MRIGIVTWITYKNYGTFLQAYSLQHFLEELGHSATIISDADVVYPKRTKPINGESARIQKQHRSLFNPLRYFRWVRSKYSTWKASRIHMPYTLSQDAYDFFEKNDLKIHYGVSIGEMPALNNQYEAFICGSDQIWNVFDYNFNGYFYLDFVTKTKISYAASIGTTNISHEKAEQIKSWLSGFHAVSVRELETANQLQEITGKKVDWVVDPTLLHGASWWASFAEKANTHTKKPYVVCYFLENKKWYFFYANALAKELNLEIVLIPSSVAFTENSYCYRGAVGPKEFVKLIQNADFVLTDSYHGSIFSLIFRKPFLYFKRFLDEEPRCQNIRVNSLFGEIGLLDLIIEEKSFDICDIKVIPYEKVTKIIDEHRYRSTAYLNCALER